MLRYRNRSKYANPADSKIKCKKCGKRGHNSAGCGRQPPEENTTQNRLSGNEIETGISETENETGPVTSSVTQSSGTSTIFTEKHDSKHEHQSE